MTSANSERPRGGPATSATPKSAANAMSSPGTAANATTQNRRRRRLHHTPPDVDQPANNVRQRWHYRGALLSTPLGTVVNAKASTKDTITRGQSDDHQPAATSDIQHRRRNMQPFPSRLGQTLCTRWQSNPTGALHAFPPYHPCPLLAKPLPP